MNSIEQIELTLLLEGVYRVSGYDFRDYALASVRRRVRECLKQEQVETLSQLQDRLLHDRECLGRFLDLMSISVTSLFRDPGFYLAFRQQVAPTLRTYPSIRLWHAGCASGQEVYSMAILLQEEGLYERCKVYATDMNPGALKKVEAGVYPLSAMKEYTANYQQAGGKSAFSEYYTAQYDNVIMRDDLKRNLVFARHNLVTDASFNEFQVILCRNVLIYFNQALEHRVLKLIDDSLASLGYLCLGAKESLKSAPQAATFTEMDPVNRIYRKTK